MQHSKHTRHTLTLRLPAQHAMLLLRHCLVAQINAKLRMLPPDLTREAATMAGDAVIGCCLNILRVQQPAKEGWDIARARRLASLPLRLGGLGLLDPLETAPAAFLAGTGEALHLLRASHPNLYIFLFQHTNPSNLDANLIYHYSTMDSRAFCAGIRSGLDWVKSTVEEAISAKIIARPAHDEERLYPHTADLLRDTPAKLQHRLTDMHHQLAWLKVLNSLTQEQKAVLRSASEAGASAAFYAIPSSKHLFIRTDLYIIQARDRIMLPGVDDDIPPCRSNPCANHPPTTYDDKDLACRALRRHQHNSAHTTRHNLVVKEFAAMFRAMEVPVTFEPIVISTPSEERRGDLLIRDPSGNNVIYDVSIVDPSGHAYSQLAAKQAGEAAKTAKKNKINKYAALCSGRAVFVPLIFESTGFIEEDVRSVLSGLRRRETDGYDCIPEYSTWAAPDAQQYWLQRISIALQRGNALCVLQALETRRTGGRTIAY